MPFNVLSAQYSYEKYCFQRRVESIIRYILHTFNTSENRIYLTINDHLTLGQSYLTVFSYIDIENNDLSTIPSSKIESGAKCSVMLQKSGTSEVLA